MRQVKPTMRHVKLKMRQVKPTMRHVKLKMRQVKPTLRQVILLPLLVLACARTPEEPVLARAGGRVITRAEFIERAEFSPALQFQGVESARPGYLLGLLIDEKLAAQAAETAGTDTTALLRQLTGYIEEMAMARELFRAEVRDKVTLDPAEIDRAVQRQAQIRTVDYLVFADEALARHYQQRLAAGEGFSAALRALYGAAADTAANRRLIRWGENEPVIEEAAWALEPGQTSGVIEVNGAFMVMRLEEITSAPALTESAVAERSRRARTVLRNRREAAESDRFIASFALARNLQFNRGLVERAAGVLADLEAPGDEGGSSLPPERQVAGEVIAGARQALATELATPLATWSGGAIILGQLLERWQGINPAIDQVTARARRRAVVRSFSLIIRDAMLAQEARRRGLDNSAAVRAEVRVWRDHYLALAWLEERTRHGRSAAAALQQLRRGSAVEADSVMLRGIELSAIPLLALRPGQYNAQVVPPWITFE